MITNIFDNFSLHFRALFSQIGVLTSRLSRFEVPSPLSIMPSQRKTSDYAVKCADNCKPLSFQKFQLTKATDTFIRLKQEQHSRPKLEMILQGLPTILKSRAIVSLGTMLLLLEREEFSVYLHT